MNSYDTKLRNRRITGKTTPGSQEAREQYKQIRLLLIGQWLGATIVAGGALYLSLSWAFFALLTVACIFGIPGQRKFLMRLRENAYPHGSPNK